MAAVSPLSYETSLSGVAESANARTARLEALLRRATDYGKLAQAVLKALDADGLANLWPVNSDYGRDAEHRGHEYAVKTAETIIAAALKDAVGENL